MKTYTLRTILVLSFVGYLASASFSQEEIKGMKQRLEFNIDELGDAEIIMSMKLNASQWDAFKYSIGNNPAHLKREIVKGLPTFYLTDFKYEEDAMDRSYKMSMKGLGAVHLNKNGKWETNLEMKDPEVIKLNNKQFRLNLNLITDGGFLEQTQLINLPKNAKNAKIETDSFGNAVLTYESGMGVGKMIAKGFGILLILSGVLLAFLNNKRKGNLDETYS